MSAVEAGGRAERELVVLLHGLSRTCRSLRRLKAALEAAGFETFCWSYPSRRHSLRELVQLFHRFLASLEGRVGPVHFIGHSLGAILIRAGLLGPRAFTCGRVVMLAPPNQGAGLVERLSGLAMLRRVYGRPSAELAPSSRFLKDLGSPEVEIGVIAGRSRFHPCNPTSWLNLAFNREAETDGTVELANTKLPGMRDFLVVDANHSFIMNHPRAIAATIAFLREGRFEQGAGGSFSR